MKSIIASLLVLSSISMTTAFANDRESREIDDSAFIPMAQSYFQETRNLVNGGCSIAGEVIDCQWEIEDSGRTPDTLYVTIKKNAQGEYYVAEGHGEIGC